MITRYITGHIDPDHAHDFTISASDGEANYEIGRLCPHEITSIVITPIAPTEFFPDTIGVDQPTPPPAPVTAAKSK